MLFLVRSKSVGYPAPDTEPKVQWCTEIPHSKLNNSGFLLGLYAVVVPKLKTFMKHHRELFIEEKVLIIVAPGFDVLRIDKFHNLTSLELEALG